MHLLLVSVPMSPSHPGFPEQTFSSVSYPSFFPQKQLFPLLLFLLFMHCFLWVKKLVKAERFTTVPPSCPQQSSINLVLMVLRQVDKVRLPIDLNLNSVRTVVFQGYNSGDRELSQAENFLLITGVP